MIPIEPSKIEPSYMPIACERCTDRFELVLLTFQARWIAFLTLFRAVGLAWSSKQREQFWGKSNSVHATPPRNPLRPQRRHPNPASPRPTPAHRPLQQSRTRLSQRPAHVRRTLCFRMRRPWLPRPRSRQQQRHFPQRRPHQRINPRQRRRNPRRQYRPRVSHRCAGIPRSASFATQAAFSSPRSSLEPSSCFTPPLHRRHSRRCTKLRPLARREAPCSRRAPTPPARSSPQRFPASLCPSRCIPRTQRPQSHSRIQRRASISLRRCARRTTRPLRSLPHPHPAQIRAARHSHPPSLVEKLGRLPHLRPAPPGSPAPLPPFPHRQTSRRPASLLPLLRSSRPPPLSPHLPPRRIRAILRPRKT